MSYAELSTRVSEPGHKPGFWVLRTKSEVWIWACAVTVVKTVNEMSGNQLGPVLLMLLLSESHSDVFVILRHKAVI